MTVTTTPDTDRMIWSFNMLMDVKATAEETGGALTVIDTWLTPAANPPMHVHHDEDEAFFLLDGEIEFFLGGTSRVAGPGDFVFGPRGVPHRFEVRSPQARMLVLGTPGGGEVFFRAMGEPAAAPTLPVAQEPDVPRVISIAAAHGIDILLPPA
ncbi:MAG: quercetin 2,3-dioxygenase [Ilumatobacteraceae bacterium]|jgi:quercetin dioxygenase-like cupin family protein|nr:quercetin 2,3-dioxygenase [Ilumatobacteraceae bacterium]